MWRGTPSDAHEDEDMQTADPPAAQVTRAVTHGPHMAVCAGCGAAGAPLLHSIHPSIHPALGAVQQPVSRRARGQH